MFPKEFRVNIPTRNILTSQIANIGPAATMYGQVFTQAGSPPQLRGLALNVANYNGWSLPSCPSYTTPNPNCDEQKYVNALAPLLNAAGFPAHFIMDTARNGVQPTAQIAQGDWCNLIGTGFGVRPTSNTGHALVDAFVWVKPGGEADVSASLFKNLKILANPQSKGNLRYLRNQIRFPLWSCGCPQTCPRGRNLVPSLLPTIARQRQPSTLSCGSLKFETIEPVEIQLTSAALVAQKEFHLLLGKEKLKLYISTSSPRTYFV